MHDCIQMQVWKMARMQAHMYTKLYKETDKNWKLLFPKHFVLLVSK